MNQSNAFTPFFSLIMPVYNAGPWISEAIESIINQKRISFTKEVQLILVDDKSTDNSYTICQSFQIRYPKNIILIENHSNQGLSKTRNIGLEYATGEYINFFDPDDILTKNTLFEIKNFINKNNEEIAHISIPLEYFEAASGAHPKYKFLGDKNRIIDLNKEGHNFILSSASSFYKKDLIKNLKFNDAIFGDEDTLFNFSLYSKITKFGYICEKNVKYMYRRRKTSNSQVDKSKITPEAFYTPIYVLNNININKNSELYYELAIYLLRSRIKNIKKSIFKDSKEFNIIINNYRDILEKIPLNFIQHKSKFADNSIKLLLLTNIYKNKFDINNNGEILIKNQPVLKINYLPLDIKEIKLYNNNLVIETLFNHFGLKNIEIVIFTEDKKFIYPQEKYYCDSVYIYRVDDIKSNETILYSRFEIPVCKSMKFKLYFLNKRNGYIHIINRLQTYSENPFLGSSIFNTRSFRLYCKTGYDISFYSRTFFIEKYNRAKKFKNRLIAFYSIYKNHKKFKWLRLAKQRKAEYWLFNDRPITANDNAEALFRYICNNYPDFSKRCYFVLDKKSPDIKRIKAIGNVVIQNSLKHKYLYLNAKYIFTSHLALNFFKPIQYRFLKYYNDLIESKIIWLQHGITMNNIESAANKFNKHVDKVVTAASFEKNIFGNKSFFYKKTEIIESGFSRYDILNSKSENIILIMPTWRSYLSGKILSSGMHDKIDGFVDSDYYKNFSELLSSSKLHNLITKNNYRIKFVLHPGLRQYAEYFFKLQSERIEIISKNSISYSQLFNKSAIMITDYSSVFFDFSYLRKPCVFFQFDEEDFYSKHYKKGIFDFHSMAPGKVCHKSDEVIDQLIHIVNNRGKMDKLYLERTNKIFLAIDNQNSSRLFTEILRND
ncbi:bifunctional glycosyltransferase/CDP-glycerol:glycerophosphate glycerophosphotransferase [Spirabiliibacterium falconis]|uniref:bifunctional glycosyltransferase/CDP-glycerol:glycerophosphate glycerophosphotransferase n=1 Tax=Spirabiliibacterium falconis TaxID=572023 RepID=UPI001AADD5FD|nr:CDP-glycerol glycerophosphotransferase family protein [Spirabiliibacterium falconis]MBE2893674.1 glycosyltransferase [Spirabiliibacterium falconis]